MQNRHKVTWVWLGLMIVALLVIAVGLLPSLHIQRLPSCAGMEIPWGAFWHECWPHGATLVFFGAAGFILSLWALVIWRVIAWLTRKTRETTTPHSVGWALLCAAVVVGSLAVTLFLLWVAFWELIGAP